MSDVYEKISELLCIRGMNRRQLAEAAEIPYSSLMSAFSRKSGSFSHDHLQRIAKALNTSVDTLLGTGPSIAHSFNEGIRWLDLGEIRNIEDAVWGLLYKQGYVVHINSDNVHAILDIKNNTSYLVSELGYKKLVSSIKSFALFQVKQLLDETRNEEE